MRSDNLRRRKYWIKFVDLYYWAYQKEYTDTFNACFTEIIKFFDGSYDNPYDTTQKLPAIFYTDEQFIECMLDMFENRRLAWPARIGYWSFRNHELIDTENKANIDIMMRMGQRITEICRLNRDKWTRLIGLNALPYNPLENYNMTEEETTEGGKEWGGTSVRTGSTTLTPTGSTQNDRSIKSAEISHVSVSGPIDSFTVQDGSITNVVFTDKSETLTEGIATTSGTEQGKTNGSSTASISGSTITTSAATGAGTTPTSTSYATTYDDNETDRKVGHSTQQGTVGSASTTQRVASQQHIRMGQIESGNPNAYGYTDTESFTNRSDTLTYNSLTDTDDKELSQSEERTLNRHGNIGVMSTQQMVEAERKLLLSAARQVLNEFANEIFLNLWD